MFLQSRVVRYLGVIFTPSELPTTGTFSSIRGRPGRSLRKGLNAEARPPPLVAMALFPGGRDNCRRRRCWLVPWLQQSETVVSEYE